MIKVKILVLPFCYYLASNAALAHNLNSLLGIWNKPRKSAANRTFTYFNYFDHVYLDSNPDNAPFFKTLHAFANKLRYDRLTPFIKFHETFS